MPKNRAFIITNPMIAANRSAEVTLSKLLRVIGPSYEELAVIGGNLRVEPDMQDVTLHSYPILRASNKLRRLLDIALLQLKMFAGVLRKVKRGETVYFWLADKMLIPYLAAKLKGADIHYFVYGNVIKEGNISTFTKISEKLIRFMAGHAGCVCFESPSVMKDWPGLSARSQKVIHLYTENIRLNDLNSRENVVGMLCRIAPVKHVVESIQAFANLHSSHPQWRLELIGSGKQEPECRELIEKLGAGEYIIMHGWVEHSKMQPITSKWKYLLAPSDHEGLPNGLIEMMGQGIPAVASPVGGVADVVVPGQNGQYLENTSVEAIEDGLRWAFARADDRTLPENAYRTIKEKFTLTAAQRHASEIIKQRAES